MDGRARARGGGRRRADARDAARGDAKARLKGGHAGGSGEGIYLLRLRAARGLQPDYLKARPTSFVCSLIHAAQMLPQVPCARSTVGLYRRCAHCPLIGSLVYLYCRLYACAAWRCQRGVEGGVPRGARRGPRSETANAIAQIRIDRSAPRVRARIAEIALRGALFCFHALHSGMKTE